MCLKVGENKTDVSAPKMSEVSHERTIVQSLKGPNKFQHYFRNKIFRSFIRKTETVSYVKCKNSACSGSRYNYRAYKDKINSMDVLAKESTNR